MSRSGWAALFQGGETRTFATTHATPERNESLTPHWRRLVPRSASSFSLGEVQTRLPLLNHRYLFSWLFSTPLTKILGN